MEEFPTTKLRIRRGKKTEKRLLSVRLETKLVKRLKHLAVDTDKTVESLVTEALTNLIAGYSKKK